MSKPLFEVVLFMRDGSTRIVPPHSLWFDCDSPRDGPMDDHHGVFVESETNDLVDFFMHDSRVKGVEKIPV